VSELELPLVVEQHDLEPRERQLFAGGERQAVNAEVAKLHRQRAELMLFSKGRESVEGCDHRLLRRVIDLALTFRAKRRFGRDTLFQDHRAAGALDLGIGLEPEAVDDGFRSLLECDSLASFAAERPLEVLPEAVQVRDLVFPQILFNIEAASIEFATLVDLDSAAGGRELAACLHHKPGQHPTTERVELAFDLVFAAHFHRRILGQSVSKDIALRLNDSVICHGCCRLGRLELLDQLRVHALLQEMSRRTPAKGTCPCGLRKEIDCAASLLSAASSMR